MILYYNYSIFKTMYLHCHLSILILFWYYSIEHNIQIIIYIYINIQYLSRYLPNKCTFLYVIKNIVFLL